LIIACITFPIIKIPRKKGSKSMIAIGHDHVIETIITGTIIINRKKRGYPPNLVNLKIVIIILNKNVRISLVILLDLSSAIISHSSVS
jgi:hypothetical protein